MPNWTQNEVTFSSAKTTNIKKIKDIFEKGCPFDQLIKEPNWPTIPLKGNELNNHFENKPLGQKGELPIIEEHKLRNGEVMKFRNLSLQMFKIHVGMIGGWKNGTLNGTSQKMILKLPILMTLVVAHLLLVSIPHGVHPTLYIKNLEINLKM